MRRSTQLSGCAKPLMWTTTPDNADSSENVVWTAGERSYAKAVVKEITTEKLIKHLVYRDDAWFNEKDYTKDLKRLGRDTNYVLFVENTPDCVRENPANGIIVPDHRRLGRRRRLRRPARAVATTRPATPAANVNFSLRPLPWSSFHLEGRPLLSFHSLMQSQIDRSPQESCVVRSLPRCELVHRVQFARTLGLGGSGGSPP